MAVTRRDFLKSLSIVVGGVTVGRAGIVNHEALAEAPVERRLPFVDAETIAKQHTQTKPKMFRSADSLGPEKWARAASSILSDNMILGCVRRGFSNEVSERGSSVHVMTPRVGGLFDPIRGPTDYSSLPTGYIHAIPLEEHLYATLDIVDRAYSRSFDELLELYVAPTMENFGQLIDELILERMINTRRGDVSGFTTVDLIKRSSACLDWTKTPMSGRSMVIPLDWEAIPNEYGSCAGFSLHRMNSKKGVAFHRDSTVLGNRPLALPDPKLGVRAGIGIVNDLAIRCMMQYNPMKACVTVTLDMLLGVDVLSPEMICIAELKPHESRMAVGDWDEYTKTKS